MNVSEALRRFLEAARSLEDIARRVGPLSTPPDAPPWLHCVFEKLASFSSGGEPRVAYLGPQGSFSHEAALRIFPRMRGLPVHSVAAAVSALVSGEVEYAIVPYENSIEGAVGETLRALAENAERVRVWLEYVHPVRLVLAARSKARVRRVYGHPHALGEAREWLEKRLPGVEVIPVASTSAAAELASREEGAAAVCSRLAARIYGLRILAEGIATRPNYTRFLVLHYRDNPENGVKTSIVAAISHQPGSLYKLLEPFAKRGINLTMIYSYPAPGTPWRYYFFIDMEGSRLDERLDEALREAGERAAWLRVLGSYPVVYGEGLYMETVG